jgi:pimeloyl-ACP methyl ester carboxylesterase
MSQLLAAEELGSGEPLVLIHGLATTRAIWNAVTPALARSRRVVTLDVPGFGESAPAGPGFELEAVADRIASGLEAHGVTAPFDLAGHSLGAGIALMLSVRRPEAVRRLVLVAPAGLASVPRLASTVLSAGVDRVLAARRLVGGLTDLEWGRRLLLSFAAAEPSAIAPTQARMMVNASAGARRTSAAFATITASDLRPLLVRAPAAIGVIWGARDRTIPVRNAQIITAVRPDAALTVVERAGHVLMIERPEAFADALEGLLARLPKDATTLPPRLTTLP